MDILRDVCPFSTRELRGKEKATKKKKVRDELLRSVQQGPMHTFTSCQNAIHIFVKGTQLPFCVRHLLIRRIINREMCISNRGIEGDDQLTMKPHIHKFEPVIPENVFSFTSSFTIKLCLDSCNSYICSYYIKWQIITRLKLFILLVASCKDHFRASTSAGTWSSISSQSWNSTSDSKLGRIVKTSKLKRCSRVVFTCACK